MEILVTNVVYRSSLLPVSKDKPLFFADGFTMTKEMSRCTERGTLIFDQISNIVDRLRPLKVSKGIVVLLKAMILSNAGKPSLFILSLHISWKLKLFLSKEFTNEIN